MDNEYNDLPRRRRRTEADPEANKNETAVVEKIVPEIKASGIESLERPEDTAAEKSEDAKPQEAPSTMQAPDSRIPDQARRMAASPYGTKPEGARRPGTRPMTAARRPGTRPAAEAARPSAPEQRSAQPRVHVGYAPGRMSEGETQSVKLPEERLRAQQKGPEIQGLENLGIDSSGKSVRQDGGRNAREYLERRKQPFRGRPLAQRPARKKSGHKKLRTVIIVLLMIVLVLAGIMMLPEDNGLRSGVQKAFNGLAGLFGGGKGGQNDDVPRVISFTASDTANLIAPTEVSFFASTGNDVTDIRLTDEDGTVMNVSTETANNTDSKTWSVTMPVNNGFDGELTLEVRRGDSDWIKTEFTAAVTVRSAAVSAEADKTEPEKTETEDTPEDGEGAEDAAETPGSEADSGTETQSAQPEVRLEDSETEPGEGDEAEASADLWREGDPDEAEGYVTGEKEPEETEGTREETEAEDAAPDEEKESTREDVPANTPAPEEEATPTPEPPPALTAEAAAEADPSLITNVTVWDGNKKIKSYSRPLKELIRMPIGGQYSKQKVGVLTFRGDAFRQNAAVGTLNGTPTGLEEAWSVEGGSSRGVSQTYYGYTWTGQPAIVKWSKQVRARSDMYETKLDKTSLKEVIIAGMDGAIRFLDLEDGSLVRNSIKLGYPLKGTPSIHPGGMPFMTAGQFARKMKVKTGRIGLRQYNLYNMKELKMIDGLDGKNHRPLNDIGSFETSALIDRTSDTLIVAGSNGALYLEAINPSFDYEAGVMGTAMQQIIMTNKVQGQKSSALLAVESSLAMYDRYVYYADMGGVLRCVDTDTLTPVWAVRTGDSVMAAVALDLNGDTLDLYTANMVNNRKKGTDIQIRRYDALSGAEIWCTDVGVRKGKDTKTDVGAKASPVIGQNGLGDLVYFTVTGLSEDGCGELGVGAEDKAALIALDKSNGKRVWAFGLESRSESSPVAVYDEAGNGWIIQCEENGTVHLLDGLTGREAGSLTLKGQIEASPAVYDDMMVIGTTGKDGSFVYGVRILTPGTEQEGKKTQEGGGAE